MLNPNERPLYLEEVAEMLRCPLSSLRMWVASGRLATIKPGQRRMVCPKDLEAFLASVRKEAS